jgi:hypothetical protein
MPLMQPASPFEIGYGSYQSKNDNEDDSVSNAFIHVEGWMLLSRVFHEQCLFSFSNNIWPDYPGSVHLMKQNYSEPQRKKMIKIMPRPDVDNMNVLILISIPFTSGELSIEDSVAYACQRDLTNNNCD